MGVGKKELYLICDPVSNDDTDDREKTSDQDNAAQGKRFVINDNQKKHQYQCSDESAAQVAEGIE